MRMSGRGRRKTSGKYGAQQKRIIGRVEKIAGHDRSSMLARPSFEHKNYERGINFN